MRTLVDVTPVVAVRLTSAGWGRALRADIGPTLHLWRLSDAVRGPTRYARAVAQGYPPDPPGTGSAAEHLPPQRREPAPHRAVEHAIAHPHHHTAQNRRIFAEMRPNVLADRRPQPLHDLPLERRIGRARQRDARVHAVEFHVHQPLIRLRDLPEETLPSATHDR